jgi:GDPmannose 4,6-dehydratase
MFGKVKTTPQDELMYHYPRSPYGCSKSFGFNTTRCYRESFGLFTCNSIGFNHESERRGVHFVTRKITRTVAEIKLGLTDKTVLIYLRFQESVKHTAHSPIFSGSFSAF